MISDEPIELKIKRLNDLAVIPTHGSERAAGWDLYAAIEEDIWISPHTSVKIGTGFAVEIPEGYFSYLVPRSGISTNQGLRLANCVGTIDEDFRGELMVPLHNDTDFPQMVQAGSRIAQFIVEKHIPAVWKEVDELSETKRGVGGFGSSGVK